MAKHKCTLPLLLTLIFASAQVGLAENDIQKACSEAIALLEAGKDLNGQPLDGKPAPADPAPANPTPPASPAKSGTLSQDQALAFFKACTIGTVGTRGLADNHARDMKAESGGTCYEACGGDYKKNRCQCSYTSLTDVQRQTVLGAMKLANDMRKWGEGRTGSEAHCASSAIVVTGGTEVGHTQGAEGKDHFSGYKLDFGMKQPPNKDCLSPYLYDTWEFVGFRRASHRGGNLEIKQISDGTITIAKDRDDKSTNIQGICQAGNAIKYLPANGGTAVTIRLEWTDGIKVEAKGANAVLETAPPHWDITFLSSDVSPTGNKSPIDLPLQACKQVK